MRTTAAAVALATLLLPARSTVGSNNSFRITLLGTGGPVPSVRRLGPSILVEAGSEKLIVDVGREVFVRLDQLHIPFAAITGVLFTHLHSDHISGLPDLWLTGRFDGQGRDGSLELWGPAGTESMARHLVEAYAFDLSIRRRRTPSQGVLVAHDIDEGVVIDRNGVRVSAFNVDHGNVKPAFGYRVEYAGRVVVLSGDTAYSEHLIDSAHGADLMIHEVAALQHDDPDRARVLSLHTSPDDAGKVFARVHPKLAVYSHIVQFGVTDAELISRTRKTYPGRLTIGADLMSFDVADDVTIHENVPR